MFGGKQDADHKTQGSGRTGNTSGGNDFAPGTQVSYDPNLITRFLGHHESLWKQYGAIAAGAAVPDYPAVMDSMQRFQRVLNEHLLEENLRLYTYLSKCLASDADSAALNNHMRQEMSDIGRAVTQFLRQYLASGVDDSNIVEFRSQLQEIGGSRAGMVLQCTKQIGCTLRLGGVVAQCAQQHRQRGAHGRLRLRRVGTKLLRHLLHGGTLQLGHQFIDQGLGSVHGGDS